MAAFANKGLLESAREMAQKQPSSLDLSSIADVGDESASFNQRGKRGITFVKGNFLVVIFVYTDLGPASDIAEAKRLAGIIEAKIDASGHHKLARVMK